MRLLLALPLFLFALTSHAALVERTVEYKEGSTTLEGFLVYDDSARGPQPGLVVVHEWMGLGDYAKRRAREFATEGYIVLAADIYGKGVRASNVKEAAELSGKFKGDRPLLRKRAQAALDYLAKSPFVDKKRLFALGYCFGGTTALELARSGAPLKGSISFHGGLDTPNLKDAKKIKGSVLILHGAIDPYVKKEEIESFYKEMDEAKVDYQFISYSGAVHSFSNPDAGSDISKGAAYNAVADRRSMEAAKAFLKELSQ